MTGTPYVTIDIGGQSRNAAYTGAGTATGQVLFGYTVLAGDRDTDGVSVLANSLTAQRRDHPGCRRLRRRHPHPLGHVLCQSQGRRWRRLSFVGLAQVGIAVGDDSHPTMTGAPATRHGSGSVRPPRPALQRHPRSRGGHIGPRTPPRPAIWARWLKATVAYDDTNGTGWTAESPTQEVLSRPTLSNAGTLTTISWAYTYDRYTRDAPVRAAVHDRIAHARLPADGSTPRALLGRRHRGRGVGGACQRHREAGNGAAFGCSPNS